MADERLDPIEQTDIRNGAGIDFLARLVGLLCDKGIIKRKEAHDLLDGLKPSTNSERSAKDLRRTVCYVSALDRIGQNIGRSKPPPP